MLRVAKIAAAARHPWRRAASGHGTTVALKRLVPEARGQERPWKVSRQGVVRHGWYVRPLTITTVLRTPDALLPEITNR